MEDLDLYVNPSALLFGLSWKICIIVFFDGSESLISQPKNGIFFFCYKKTQKTPYIKALKPIIYFFLSVFADYKLI